MSSMVFDMTAQLAPVLWCTLLLLLVSVLAILGSLDIGARRPTGVTRRWDINFGHVTAALVSLVAPFRRFEGPRLVRCPEIRGIVEIELAALRAALTSAFGKPRLRVAHCTRWPERKGCDQACLNGIDALWARSHGLLTR